jgi:hypothetical protein
MLKQGTFFFSIAARIARALQRAGKAGPGRHRIAPRYFFSWSCRRPTSFGHLRDRILLRIHFDALKRLGQFVAEFGQVHRFGLFSPSMTRPTNST